MTETFTDLVDTAEPHWRVVGRQWRELLPEGSYSWPIADFRHKDHPTLGQVVYTWHGGVLTATLHLLDSIEQTESNWAVLQAAEAERRHYGGEGYLIWPMSLFIEDPDRWAADTGRLSAPGRVLADPESPPPGYRPDTEPDPIPGFSPVPIVFADVRRRADGHRVMYGPPPELYPRLTATSRRLYWDAVASDGTYVWQISNGERQLGYVLYIKSHGAVTTRLLPDAGVNHRELHAAEQAPETFPIRWASFTVVDAPRPSWSHRRRGDAIMADVLSVAAAADITAEETGAPLGGPQWGCSIPGCGVAAAISFTPRPKGESSGWAEFHACADHAHYVYCRAFDEQDWKGDLVIEYPGWHPDPYDHPAEYDSNYYADAWGDFEPDGEDR